MYRENSRRALQFGQVCREFEPRYFSSVNVKFGIISQKKCFIEHHKNHKNHFLLFSKTDGFTKILGFNLDAV